MTRADEAYEVIKAAILSWEYAPGEPLSEAQLGARVGASRTPVREALQRLNVEGLVRLVPGRGAFVSEISVGDVVEVFELREMLEGAACRLAAARFSAPDHRDALEELIEAFLAFAVVPADDFDRSAYYELTADLDASIRRLADNERLTLMWNSLYGEIQRMRHFASSDSERLLASTNEHIEILRAILRSDEDQAEATARAHVRSSRANILAGLVDAPGRSRVSTGQSAASPKVGVEP